MPKRDDPADVTNPALLKVRGATYIDLNQLEDGQPHCLSKQRKPQASADEAKSTAPQQPTDWPPGRRAKYGEFGLETQGIPTGFTDLDYLTGGLCPGELTLLVSRHGNARTTFASQIAAGLTECSLPMLFISRVDDCVEIRNRMMLSHQPGFSAASSLVVDDSEECSVEAIAEQAHSLKNRDGLALLIVDYLQFLNSSHAAKDRQSQNEEVARRLQSLAREKKVPVFCTVRLPGGTQDGTDAPPRIADLHHEGRIDCYADIVLFLHRRTDNATTEDQTVVPAEEMDVVVVKNSGGPTGTVPLSWCQRDGRFENVVSNDSGLTADEKAGRLIAIGIEDRTEPSPEFGGLTIIGAPMPPPREEKDEPNTARFQTPGES